MIEKHDREKMQREAERAVNEAGGGESEGFEMAEEALRRHAEGIEDGGDPLEDASPIEAEDSGAVYSEADQEYSAERPGSDHD
jgi:exonuclease VII small subunit